QAVLKESSRFDLVEAGPGNGLLAFQILKTLREDPSNLFQQITYYMVESSPDFVQRQKALFDTFPDLRSKVVWVNSIQELPPIDGTIFSNEFLDALPVHRVVWKGDLQEIYVDYQAGQWIEILKPLSDPEIGHYFKKFPVNWIENQEGEVNLNALSWIRDAGQKLNKGFLITIDYGDYYEELYSIRRRKGTLLCYRNHKTGENPYESIGEQDMTSHLNFSALQEYGREVELSTLGYVEQSHFLIGLGMIEEIDRYVQTLKDPTCDPVFRAMKYLIHPEGLGPVFKVLIQEKGIGEIRLDGLKYARKPFQK
ncbi:MAG: SAM-dependent methyltransferase, partial [Nitrospirae bacterium]|nr:SAM-dependent methyltransferase [Nitrospirota bacterium]